MVVPVIMVTAGWPGAKGVVSGKYPVSVMVHDGHYEEKDIEVLKEAFDAKYDGWKMKPNDKLMEKIGQTAAAYKGEEYRRANRETLLDSSYVDPVSYTHLVFISGTALPLPSVSTIGRPHFSAAYSGRIVFPPPISPE